MRTIRDAILTVSVILPVLAIIAVYLRFYARRAMKLAYLADDWSVLPALVRHHLVCNTGSIHPPRSVPSSPASLLSMACMLEASVSDQWMLNRQDKLTR